MIPKTLVEIKKYLQDNPLSLSNESRDGRVNSSKDEDLIIEHLRRGGFDKSRFKVADQRSWCDIWLVEENIPVNIKSTSCKTADNAGNFLLLNWCFTTRSIKLDTSPKSSTDIKHLVEATFEDPKRDYWFLVVNKTDPKDVIVNSILHLKDITVNSSNMPFQVNWSKNRTLVDRTYANSRGMFFNCIKNAWKKHPYQALSLL